MYEGMREYYIMYKQNTEEMIQTPFKINKELDAIIPKLNPEKFAALKADIKSNGLKHPIEVMADKTVIDGHNRYKACTELGIHFTKIDFVVLPKIASIQEAKEYSIEINFFRRQMETYVAATWALNVYNYIGSSITEKAIGQKVGMSNQSISIVKVLNEKLLNLGNREKALEFKNKFESNDEKQRLKPYDVLGQLNSAENIDNIIAVVDTRVLNAPNAINMTKEKAKAFKAQLEAEYFEKKYDKKSLKAINTQIDKVENPQLYAPIEESDFATAVQKIAPKLNDLKSKFPATTRMYQVTTDEGFIETGQAIKDLAGQNKLYAIIVMFELPKELVNDE
jgi:ParB-like chromosome segregation protein Spo0J